MSPSKIQHMFGFYKNRIKNFHVFSKSVVIEFYRTAKEKLSCPVCKSSDITLSGVTNRTIRDLSISGKIVYLQIPQNRINCPECGIYVEQFSFIDRYSRFTRRFEKYVHMLCQVMTIKDVSRFLHISWDQVKNIDKKYLEKKYRNNPHWKRVRNIGIDEIAIKKGHQYLTIVVNLDTGNIIYAGKHRTQQTLEIFFHKFGPIRCKRIRSVAMDDWNPYKAAVENHLPNANIIYDKYHIIAAFNRLLDQLRREEFHKASKENQKILKGSRFLLLKHESKLSNKQQLQLNQLLQINTTLNTAYILKDDLRQLYNNHVFIAAYHHLFEWIQNAKSTNIPLLKSFAKRVSRNFTGIINYFDTPITTAKVEGINNKIKVLKRKMYGFTDLQYFTLKLYDLNQISFGFT